MDLNIWEKFWRYSSVAVECFGGARPHQNITVGGVTYFVEDVCENRITSTTAYILRKVNSKKIVVVFKGTREFMDFILDGIAFRTRFKYAQDIKVHAGFQIAYNSIREKLVSALKMFTRDGDMVTFYGHSLGGSLTTLALIDMIGYTKRIGMNVDLSAYTVGSPRVVTEATKKYIAGSVKYISRAWNSKDIIPTLPGECMGYTHVGDSYECEPLTVGGGLFKYHDHLGYNQSFSKHFSGVSNDQEGN